MTQMPANPWALALFYLDCTSMTLMGQKYRLRIDNHSLVWLMSLKEPQGQVARWLGRLQYDSEIQRHPER